jgi:hypothetical protein
MRSSAEVIVSTSRPKDADGDRHRRYRSDPISRVETVRGTMPRGKRGAVRSALACVGERASSGLDV